MASESPVAPHDADAIARCVVEALIRRPEIENCSIRAHFELYGPAQEMQQKKLRYDLMLLRHAAANRTPIGHRQLAARPYGMRTPVTEFQLQLRCAAILCYFAPFRALHQRPSGWDAAPGHQRAADFGAIKYASTT